MEYYYDVNAVIPQEKDEFYKDVYYNNQNLISTWGLTTSEDYVSPEKIKELEAIFHEKVRQHTNHKKDEVKLLFQG